MNQPDAPSPPIDCPTCGARMEAGWAQAPLGGEAGGGGLAFTTHAPEEGALGWSIDHEEVLLGPWMGAGGIRRAHRCPACEALFILLGSTPGA